MMARGWRRGWLFLGLVCSALASVQAADRASLQRGERMFMADCAACHSLKYLRYSRLQQDLDLSPEEVRRDLQRFGAKAEGPVISPMTPRIAGYAFGKLPPDLSLETAVRGPGWVRRYLGGFYLDPSAPQGWNNAVLQNAAMPDPFWRLQGIRANDGHGRPGGLLVPGQVAPRAFAGQLDDLVAFLSYAATPDVIQRRVLGPWVLAFLALFTALAWALKRVVWKDVKGSRGAT
ncbi:cytochrome c1 [Frateuria aurantia]|nr:cytochrome c1 [Frateuria aurantia]